MNHIESLNEGRVPYSLQPEDFVQLAPEFTDITRKEKRKLVYKNSKIGYTLFELTQV